MKGAFFIATIMCITGTYQIFDQAVALGALGGNKSVEFVAVALWKFMFSFEGVGKAMTMTFIVGVPLFIIAMLLTRIQRKLSE